MAQNCLPQRRKLLLSASVIGLLGDWCLSLHCHVILLGLRLMTCLDLATLSKTAKKFSYVERKQIWPRGNHRLFSLFSIVSLVACPDLSGDPMASYGMWAAKRQCAQPGPALPVPMANLPCNNIAGTVQLFVWALRGARKKDFLWKGFHLALKPAFCSSKKWKSELLERVKPPIQSPPLRKLLLHMPPLQSISGDFGVWGIWSIWVIPLKSLEVKNWGCLVFPKGLIFKLFWSPFSSGLSAAARRLKAALPFPLSFLTVTWCFLAAERSQLPCWRFLS